MVGVDIYKPEQWSDFFILVGTGAVTLTGLVFVAMALNLKVIAVDATHRWSFARYLLQGLHQSVEDEQRSETLSRPRRQPGASH